MTAAVISLPAPCIDMILRGDVWHALDLHRPAPVSLASAPPALPPIIGFNRVSLPVRPVGRLN